MQALFIEIINKQKTKTKNDQTNELIVLTNNCSRNTPSRFMLQKLEISAGPYAVRNVYFAILRYCTVSFVEWSSCKIKSVNNVRFSIAFGLCFEVVFGIRSKQESRWLKELPVFFFVFFF